jgi:membrane protein implicated in regulation of membrane protease activity
MWHFIFDTLWGWWGVAGAVVIACAALGYLFPTLRLQLFGVAGVVLASASLVTKGARDEAAREKRRRDEAVKKLGGEYDEIEKRTDSGRAGDRLRDGSL